MVAVQRTWSDLKLNPHVHAVFLDGGHREEAGGALAFDIVFLRDGAKLRSSHVFHG